MKQSLCFSTSFLYELFSKALYDLREFALDYLPGDISVGLCMVFRVYRGQFLMDRIPWTNSLDMLFSGVVYASPTY